MDTGEALEAVTGAVLSDAGLVRQAKSVHFEIALSGEEHLDWLNYLYKAVKALGVVVAPPYAIQATSRGVKYTKVHLRTRVHPVLTGLWDQWYKIGAKEVPSNLNLTPITLANWFMGDGGCYHSGQYVAFATDGYSPTSVSILQDKLKEIGIPTGAYLNKHVRDGSGLSIWTISGKSTAVRLVGIIEPYVLSSYRYKISALTEKGGQHANT